MTAQVSAPPFMAEPPASQQSKARSGILREGAVAVGVWLAVSLVAVAATTRDLHPLDNRAVMGPQLALLAVAPVAVILWHRWRPGWLPAAAVGYLAGWVVFLLRMSLQGTPVTFGGHVGDAGRLAALATRYSVTAMPSDAYIPGITGEYPPLLPWLAGRTAALLGVQGWQLLGDMEILFSSLTLVVGFLLWRLITPAWTAMAVSALTTLFLFHPPKAFSVLTLVTLVPVVLGVTATRPRRIPWAVAGTVLGLTMVTYWGWILMSFFGILVCVVIAWRQEQHRRQYVIYLAKVACLALVLSSWFVVPLIHGMLTNWGPSTGDTYGITGMHEGLFPFLQPNLWAAVQLVGLFGLLWLRGSKQAWWAAPLLWLTLGAYAFRLLGMADFFLTNHSLLFHYTERIYSTVLIAACVLAVSHAAPLVAQRFAAPHRTQAVAPALTLAVLWASNAIAVGWMPGTNGGNSFYPRAAYAEPLPDGSYTINGLRLPAEERRKAIPARQVEQEVRRVRGAAAKPMTVSAQESFFVYVPWPGFIGEDRGASANSSRWDERFAELERIAAISDPQEFARASATTRFGAVDLFLLAREGESWRWKGHVAASIPPMIVDFHRAQFAAGQWEIVELPDDFVAVIRR